MTGFQDIPIPYRIVALMQERNRLFAFPLERLAEEVRAAGFRCNGCGTCCTRSVNNHIFLLDHDVTDSEKDRSCSRMNRHRTRSSATRTACFMFPGMHSG